ncbi:MAG: DUF6263 family protein [Flavisolibacter sp.]
MYGCNSADSGKGTMLKFNLQKGKTYAYSIEFDPEAQMKQGKMASKMRFDYIINVLDESSDAKRLKVTFKRIATQMGMPNGGMNFDTDSMPRQQNSKDRFSGTIRNVFNAMKGKSFEMKVDESGHIEEITGTKEMAESMVNAMNLDANMKQIVLQMFNTQFSDESIKKSFDQALNIYPAKRVNPGDKWTKQTSIEFFMMNASMSTNYTVKEIKGNLVTLVTDGTLEMNNGNGTSKGTMIVDAATGLVKEANITQNVRGNFNLDNSIKITGVER